MLPLHPIARRVQAARRRRWHEGAASLRCPQWRGQRRCGLPCERGRLRAGEGGSHGLRLVLARSGNRVPQAIRHRSGPARRRIAAGLSWWAMGLSIYYRLRAECDADRARSLVGRLRDRVAALAFDEVSEVEEYDPP